MYVILLLQNTCSIFVVFIQIASITNSNEIWTDLTPITLVNFSAQIDIESTATSDNSKPETSINLSDYMEIESTTTPKNLKSTTTFNFIDPVNVESTTTSDRLKPNIPVNLLSQIKVESTTTLEKAKPINPANSSNSFDQIDVESTKIPDNSKDSFHPRDTSEAVFASTFLRDCEYEEARNSLRVERILDVDSYSGFITVNTKYNSNLFFWFILSEQNPVLDPVIVWLMGYPGYSSMYGVFQENGPFRLVSGVLNSSKHSWTKRYNVLYIDNPVGIGYSFTDNEAGLSRSQEDVSNNLYTFLSQFYEIFSQFRKNELYIGAESYAGKYAISLAYKIHHKNPITHTKMNLQGIFVGNGFLDPENMLDYSTFLFQLGIIDHPTFLWMQKLEDYITRLIRMKDWKNALINYNKIHDKLKEVGFEHPYDFTKEKFDLLQDQVAEYLNQPETRNMLHVGEVPFHNDELVYEYLHDDILQSVKPMVEELLPYYRMLFYAGQLDIFVTRAKMNKFARKLRWINAIQFAKQKPINWYLDGEIAGYIQSVSNLTEVLVRNANHMSAASQPLHTFCLLRLFVDGGPFNETTLDMISDD